MEISNEIIAIWGALLSTILAGIKIWEYWSNRDRIETSYFFGANSDTENHVTIRNVSDKPITIKHWNLLFCERKLLRWRPYHSKNYGEYTVDISIKAHSSHTLKFAESDYFDWRYKALKGKRIYIELHVVGRKRLLKKFIYKP